MEPIARKADGRRMFTPEFKREQMERLVRGEVTISEQARAYPAAFAPCNGLYGPRGRGTHAAMIGPGEAAR